MSIDFQFDNDSINALIDRAFNVNNTRSLMERTSRVAHTDTMMNFRNSTSPDGNAWAPVRSRQGKPLLDTGRLRNSITAQVSDDEASIGTNLIYARVHQFGATIKPKKGKYLHFKIGNSWVKTAQVVITARPFIGFGERLIGKINKETQRWAEDILNGD